MLPNLDSLKPSGSWRKGTSMAAIGWRNKSRYLLSGPRKQLERDYTKAVKWWRKGADKGDHDSQCYLSHCHRHGEGVRKKRPCCRTDWYMKSADQGNDNAKFALGKMLIAGNGGSKDFRLGWD